MDCNTCSESRGTSIPYIAYESAMARGERHLRRVVMALVVAIIGIVLSNVIWLIAWSQYDYIGESCVVDAVNGVANYIGNDGDIVNGTDHR